MTSAAGSTDVLSALLSPEGLLDSGAASASADRMDRQICPVYAVADSGQGRMTPAQMEQEWSRAHPEGRVNRSDDGSISLWNFDIGKSDLKPEHAAALDDYIRSCVLMAPSSVVAGGYTSTTGPDKQNFDLGLARAQAVADYCFRAGLKTVDPGNAGVFGDGTGLSMATARSVRVDDGNPLRAAPAPPVARLVGGAPSTVGSPSTPLVLSFPIPGVIDIETGALPIYEIPDALWIAGKLTFTGKIRFTFASREVWSSLQLAFDGGSDVSALKVTHQLCDGIAARLSVKTDRTAALSAIVGPQQWEVGVQSGPYPMFVKTQTFPLVKPLVLGDDYAQQWGGSEVTVALSGQLQFSFRPGSEAELMVSEWFAGLEIAAAEAAVLVGGVVSVGAIFYSLAKLGDPANGLRRAGLLAGRMGYAGGLAVTVAHGGTESDADAFLKGWHDDANLRAMAEVVDSARRQATADLDGLHDGRAAKIATLQSRFAAVDDAQIPTYGTVAARLLAALGGADPGGDGPSLSVLDG